MYGKETNFLPDVWEKIYFSMLAYALLAFPEYINKISYHAGLLNFKKAMAILIVAMVNYLLDIVSPGGSIMFGARGKIVVFGVPR